MRRWISMVVLAALAAVSAGPARAQTDPLRQARAALEAGDLERFLEAMGDAWAAPPAESAALLARAGEVALRRHDAAMASVFCERALGRAPKERAAHEVCLRAAVAEARWEDATRYGDALARSAAGDAEIALLRAQASLGEGDWGRARELLRPHAAGPLAARVAPLLARADRGLASAAEGAEQAALEARLERAVAQARALRAEEPALRRAPDEIVLYTTEWCSACKTARRWLRERGIDFEEKDVEKDRDARRELAEKSARARLRGGGVPVLDARGTLLRGFDAEAWTTALE